ncbi:Queuosine synthesis-like protein [Solidesulfovibrio carbinoliphilus subsp. oakridgensis]|uniref:7-cyano-7-deazaguanine synthase n=1 Tax=Solidesulfovibrio carbinoliphilus subsp. oakridgensis TaxID=694327 RepID=G7QAY2_9BACT|nr:7-cyano-7-deazaguanine synthase [Solidesulfovibrio carbinoliphilus]EHJ48323.1 Queuosine synthesis-like protein [Solidesulfovibrio carbinoliphilus subsp. oakridgensis]
MVKNSAILLSGGMDSTSLAFWKKPNFAFTIDYGQKAAMAEIRAARQVAKEIGISHDTIAIDCSSLGSGDMAMAAPLPNAPSTDWWPFRNQLLITLAAMKAICRNINLLYIGLVKSDSSYKDGCSDFVDKISRTLSFQEGNIEVMAPAIDMTAAELVNMSKIPRTLLAWSHSCHVSDFACGRCRGCNKHRLVMEECYGKESC